MTLEKISTVPRDIAPEATKWLVKQNLFKTFKQNLWLVEQNLIEECAAIKWQQLPRGADGPAANLFVYKKAPLNALALLPQTQTLPARIS